VGLRDLRQPYHAVRRNFPVLGNMRFLLESIGPEVYQYFIEKRTEAAPFSKDDRAVVYQRAKDVNDTMSFGTRHDVYSEGFEWVSHSIWPKKVPPHHQRVLIGGPLCTHPYSAARLNISAMSYGALSDHAILALNTGAAAGNFYHNTGEGGVSRFHLAPAGDIVWNIGTGYFGCRDPDSATPKFYPDRFAARAVDPRVKMIELKISQGAKPGHGGMLPGAKVTEAIAEARGVEVGETCHSPPTHSAFSDARGLCRFIGQLRELSGGKPVGFKLCIGQKVEFATIVGAMIETGITPDFITVDGAEGGTGAAPPEFSNHVGFPMKDGLSFVHNILLGAGLRRDIKLIASGKVLTGFSMVRTAALGADVMNSARAFMFALGCIQSLKCANNTCPTGITTSNPVLMNGLVVETKAVRVENFQRNTLKNFFEMVGAMGLEDPGELSPRHVMIRMAGGSTSKSYEEVFPTMEEGALLRGDAGETGAEIQAVWDEAQEILKNTR